MLILIKLKKTFKKKHSRPYFLLNNISLVKNTVMQMKMKFLQYYMYLVLKKRKDWNNIRFYTFTNNTFYSQRRKAMKTPHRDDVNKKKQEMLFTGPMTLTSLMSKDKENKASDHIYLQLDSLFKEDVFVSMRVFKV